MIDFAYSEGDSLLHRMDPAVKLIGLLILSLLILLTGDLPGLILSLTLLSILIILSKIPLKTLLLPLRRLIPFLLIVFLMNVFFYTSESCLFSVSFLCISEAGLRQAFNILQHTASVTILSALFIRTTTSIQIMHGIETCLRPLRFFRVPTRDIALIMSIALQFIPVFFTDLDRIRKAQTARGADFTGGTLLDKSRAVFPLVIPAFVSAFRRADDLANAIEARGYRGDDPDIY